MMGKVGEEERESEMMKKKRERRECGKVKKSEGKWSRMISEGRGWKKRENGERME